MTYDFSFEKKSVAAILACAAVLCALLFFAGVMVGVGWHAREDSRDDVASTPGAARVPARTALGVAPAPASRNVATQAPPATAYALPQEPVLYEDPARREYAAEGYGPRPYDAQPYGGAQGYGDARDYAAQDYAAQTAARRDYAAPDGYASGGYALQRYAARGADAQASTPEAAPAQAPAATGRSEAARLSARGIDPDPRLVEEAGASAEGSGAGARASSSYTVQVGTYLEEGDAQRVARELENKGYTPKVISGLDAEARTWYAVRIGSYGSAREAGTAASNFSKQEGLKAAVRPAGSL
jgi:hypothetical protein